MSNQAREMEQLLNAMMDPDPAKKEQRAQAEEFFHQAKNSQPEATMSSLYEIITSSSLESKVRTLAAVLIRKMLSSDTSKEGKWPLVSENLRGQIKQGLLIALEQEKDNHTRTTIADCVSTVAKTEMQNKNWNELLPFLFKMVQSENSGHRHCALLIFQQMAITIGDELKPHHAVLKEIFVSGLKDSDLKVKIAAIGAIQNFLDSLDSQQRQTFQLLLPDMLSVISACLNASDEINARDSIEHFIALAEFDPLFMRPQLSYICNAMFTIASAGNLEPETRHLALEFLLTLAENRPQLVRKTDNFVQNLVPILLTMMMKVEDDPDWNEQEKENESDDENDDDDVEIGNESLDRIAIAMGGKTVVPIVFGILSPMLTNEDWKQRYTGLMAMSIIGEGCQEALLQFLPEVVVKIVAFATDPHPRVRWAFCNAVGQMSTDFGPDFQKLFVADVIPALMRLMDDVENPRVQSHAAAAVINFCEHATKDQLSPYLDSLMNKFAMLLNQGKKIVIEQTITAIAAVADCAEEHFTPYYDQLMPMLKSVLHNAKGKEYRNMRGKAMECISLIGTAVGREKFGPDAQEIMSIMMQTQSKLDADDPQQSYLLQSWARIAKCLKEDFVPFLEYVMPPLLQAAAVKPDEILKRLNHEENLTEDDAWEMAPLLEPSLGHSTSILEEKATACNMLYSYAFELKEAFFPWVAKTAEVLVPLIKFYWSDSVRTAAITVMPHLLASAKSYLSKNQPQNEQDYLRQLFNFMHPFFLKAMTIEEDLETLVILFESFKQCISITGNGCLEADRIPQAIEATKNMFEGIKKRREERHKNKVAEDFDEEENEKVEEEAETDLDVLTQLAEFIGHHVKAHPETVEQWGVLLPYFKALIDPQSAAVDRQVGMCIFCDIVEFGAERSMPFFDHFVPLCLNYLVDPDANVRQAAVYGIGCVAQVGVQYFSPMATDVMQKLSQVIQKSDSRNEENIYATENAIGAVGKIAMFHDSALGQNAATAVNFFVQCLPVTKDTIEAKVTYGRLCEFIEKNNAHIFGENYSNLPRFLSIFANIIGTELVDTTLSNRIVHILSVLKNGIPQQIDQAMKSLSSEDQQKLNSLQF